MSISVEISLVLLTLAALTFFGLNLMVSTRDVMLVRIDVPSESKAKLSWLKPNPLPTFLQIRFTKRRGPHRAERMRLSDCTLPSQFEPLNKTAH